MRGTSAGMVPCVIHVQRLLSQSALWQERVQVACLQLQWPRQGGFTQQKHITQIPLTELFHLELSDQDLCQQVMQEAMDLWTLLLLDTAVRRHTLDMSWEVVRMLQ